MAFPPARRPPSLPRKSLVTGPGHSGTCRARLCTRLVLVQVAVGAEEPRAAGSAGLRGPCLEFILKRKKLNRYDKFNSFFYKKVQDGFIKILKKNPKKYMKIDSNMDINLNKKIIINKINNLI